MLKYFYLKIGLFRDFLLFLDNLGEDSVLQETILNINLELALEMNKIWCKIGQLYLKQTNSGSRERWFNFSLANQ